MLKIVGDELSCNRPRMCQSELMGLSMCSLAYVDLLLIIKCNRQNFESGDA